MIFLEPQLFFNISACIALSIIAFVVPKKLKRYELYTTTIFAVLFGLVVDSILAVRFKFYMLDEAGVQIPALIGQVVLYAASNIIILNTFPYSKAVKTKLLYILFISLLTIGFEYIASIFGFIKYREWKMWYSALAYPFLISFLLLHLRFFRWLSVKS